MQKDFVKYLYTFNINELNVLLTIIRRILPRSQQTAINPNRQIAAKVNPTTMNTIARPSRNKMQ